MQSNVQNLPELYQTTNLSSWILAMISDEAVDSIFTPIVSSLWMWSGDEIVTLVLCLCMIEFGQVPAMRVATG